MAANMLEGVDGEEWKARGLSKGDVMFALALGSILLRINSIELGLKHILDRKMGRPVPKRHDLVMLWNRLTDEWREKVAEASRSHREPPLQSLRSLREGSPKVCTLQWPLTEDRKPAKPSHQRSADEPPERNRHDAS